MSSHWVVAEDNSRLVGVVHRKAVDLHKAADSHNLEMVVLAEVHRIAVEEVVRDMTFCNNEKGWKRKEEMFRKV